MKNLYYTGWYRCSFKETEVSGNQVFCVVFEDMTVSIYEKDAKYLLYIEYIPNVSMPVGVIIPFDTATKFFNLKETEIKNWVKQILPFIINT